MDERIITPSFHHREVDRKEEEIQNAITSDLNKIKARRRRNSSRGEVEQKNQNVEQQSQNVEQNSLKYSRIAEGNSQDVFVEDAKSSSTETSTHHTKVC